MVDGRLFEKSNRYIIISAAVRPIATKFGAVTY